jgi:hypothetical protein
VFIAGEDGQDEPAQEQANAALQGDEPEWRRFPIRSIKLE